MNLSKESTGLPFHINRMAHDDMVYLSQRVTDTKRRLDGVMVYSGMEGSGKSTLAFQHAQLFCNLTNQTFGLDNLYFSPEQLYDAVMRGDKPPGTLFLYDEAVSGLLAGMANSKIGIKMNILFSTCRSKGYAIFILIPRLVQLPQWMAIDRSLGLFETYTKWTPTDPHSMGFYKGYNQNAKMVLYHNLKKKNFSKKDYVRCTQEMTFSQWPFSKESKGIPFSYQEYEQYKRKILSQQEVKTELNVSVWRRRFVDVIEYVHDYHDVSYSDIEKLIGIGRQSLYETRKKVNALRSVKERNSQ